MAAELIQLFPQNPDPRKVDQVIRCLQDGGLIIYPTDTVYAMGCDIFQNRAVERLCQIKGIKVKNNNLSIICEDLSNIAAYAKVSNAAFKIMKRAFPGPFTFILPTTHELPKTLQSTRKSIGIRVPDHEIPHLLVERLGNPIITASVKNTEDDFIEYPNEIEVIYDQNKHLVDIVIDGGWCGITASTVIDATTDEFDVIRQGLGNLSDIM